MTAKNYACLGDGSEEVIDGVRLGRVEVLEDLGDRDELGRLEFDRGQAVDLENLSVAARVQDTVYYFPGRHSRTLVDDSLHRDVLRAMLQHALDQLDEPIERTLDGRPA